MKNNKYTNNDIDIEMNPKQEMPFAYNEDEIINQINELKQLIHETGSGLDKDFSEIEDKIEALINRK